MGRQRQRERQRKNVTLVCVLASPQQILCASAALPAFAVTFFEHIIHLNTQDIRDEMVPKEQGACLVYHPVTDSKSLNKCSTMQLSN